MRFIFLLLICSTLNAQIILETTSETLELATSSTAGIDYQINFVDLVLSTGGTPGALEGKITSATTTTVVSAPASSTYRLIKVISFKNIGTASNIITVKKDISGTEYQLFYTSLGQSEMLTYSEAGWQIFDKNGKLKTSDLSEPVYSFNKFIMKSFTAADAAGYWYAGYKDAGFPGVWTIGTPGLTGRTTDGTSTTDAGCIYFPDASAGLATYLDRVDLSATALQSYYFMDVVWVNTGLVVTTTTAQTINSVAFPARDNNGTSNGEGYMIGLISTAANTNAAVISNSTVSYTNELGTAGRTATLQAVVGYQIPATPVIGTVVWFQLQAGDAGVRSIQSITLGTSLVTGSLSMIVARPITSVPVSVINQIFSNNNPVRVYDDSCILPFFQAQNGGTSVISGNFIYSTR